MDRMSLAGLWLQHLRAYPLLCLPGLFCSSFVYSPFGVGARAKHCFLFGFVPGLDMGEEGMLQNTNVLPGSEKHGRTLPSFFSFFMALSCQALGRHMVLVQTEIRDEGQEWLRILPTDFQPWISGFLLC